MLTKYDFELKLEEIAEEFFFNAASALVATRGGNSRGNEVYFATVNASLRKKLNCQQIILPDGECPDSGIFGDFHYNVKESINWELVRLGKIVVLELKVPNNQNRFIQIEVKNIILPELIDSESEISLKLNECDTFGEFFGIEFKAKKNSTPNAISVASFNSTCPSNTKTAEIKIAMIHNLPTSMRKIFDNDKSLKKCEIKLKIQFSMYYFIVNDVEKGTRSEIKHIFVCNGGFFAPTTTEAEAELYSKQIMPSDERLNIEINLYRVKLRYRPFFESRVINANGFGLYTSWKPKIPEQAREEKEREQLLQEVEQVQQTFIDERNAQDITIDPPEQTDNVIYLNLREERIRRRSVA